MRPGIDIQKLIDLDDLEAIGVRDSALRKLSEADDHDDVSINVKMHAIQWKRLLAIRYYRMTAKNDARARRGIASTLYPIIDKIYDGIIHQLRKEQEGEQPETKPAEDPDEEEPIDEEAEEREDEPVGFHVHRPRRLL